MSDSHYISPETQEAFERFLLDRMDAPERSVFLESLKSDPELNERFMEFKNMFRAVEESALRESMDSFHAETGNQKINISSKFKGYKIAAAIALLVGVGFWFLFQKSTNERLYQEYFIVDPGLPTVMGTTNNYDFYEAMVDYKQGHYRTAISKWEKLLPQKADNDTLNYFLGSAYLANGEAQKAIGFMKKALEKENSAFQEDIQFYLGLANLKLNNKQKALEFLTQCNRENCRELASKIE